MDPNFVVDLLDMARQLGASSIHLKVPAPPSFRVGRTLIPIPYGEMRPDDTEHVASTLLKQAGLGPKFSEGSECEFVLSLPGTGRFRVTLFRQRGSVGLTLHCVHMLAPSLAMLGFSPAAAIGPERSGLALIGGERRRDLIAALLDARNRAASGHLVSIEERLRYLHADALALVSQQEVGLDTQSFSSGLRSALLIDADWIALGDLPDEESAALALQYSDGGERLVLSAVPPLEPSAAIEWFIDRFAPEEKARQRSRLAKTLIGVWSLGVGVGRHMEEAEARALAWRP